MLNTALPFVYVGIGGLFGALLRYAATLLTQNMSLTFPYGTLLSNLTGCFVIGVIVELATRTDWLSSEARLFLATGLCGAFTTLSSVVYELAKLMQDRELFIASVYFGATFLGAATAFYLGLLLVAGVLRA